MKLKKLILGGTATALVLTMSATAYAANSGLLFQENVSLPTGEGAFSFEHMDQANVPEGTVFQSEVNMTGEDAVSLDGATLQGEGVFSFEHMDQKNMPEGTVFQSEVNMTGEDAVSLDGATLQVENGIALN